MALRFCLLVFFAVCCCTYASSETFLINTSTALEHYMCNYSDLNVELVLELDSSIHYCIQKHDFCIVHSRNMTVRSNSNNSCIVTCPQDHHNPCPTMGFAFINATITLQGVTFINCGTYLNKLPDNIINMFNSSSLYYSSTHAAALLFIQCTVNMIEVELTSSYGFAVIGINLMNSALLRVNATNSTSSSEIYMYNNASIGNGIMIHFFNDTSGIIGTHHVSIEHCTFQYNIDFRKQMCVTDIYNDLSAENEVVNAAALTILYSQKNYQAKVFIKKSFFIRNLGTLSGSLLVVHYGSENGDLTVIKNSIFTGSNLINSKHCNGAALSFNFLSPLWNNSDSKILGPLTVENTNFSNSQIYQKYYQSGAVYIGVAKVSEQMKLVFRNVTFTKNFAAQTGVCVLVESLHGSYDDNICFVLESVTANANSLATLSSIASSAGMFVFHGVNCYINGTKERPSNFSNNFGIVVDAMNANIYLSGDVLFDSNKGTRGAAIKITDNSRLFFMNELTVIFLNNQAELLGGAIFAEVNRNGNCSFYIRNSKSINATFLDNQAIQGGNDIYAYPIFSCYFNDSTTFYTSSDTMNAYEEVFHFSNAFLENKLLNFSTKATKLLICSKSIVTAYPGKTFSLQLAANDSLDRFVYTTVGVEIVPKNTYTRNYLSLSYQDKEQIISESYDGICTSINFTVHVHIPKYHNHVIEGILTLSLPDYPAAVYSHVHVLPCPPGFILDNITTGDCVCSPALYAFAEQNSGPFSCSIQTLTFTRSTTTNSWAGLIEDDNGSKRFGISLACPVGSCESNQLFDYFYSAEMETAVAYEANDSLYTAPLCVNHREGTLCGKCNEGLSTVFGYRNCDHCSNKWLWTIPIYLGLGPLLVYLLYALRLTLTAGTLNGIIFYAQAANGGLIDLLTLHNSGTIILKGTDKLAIGFLSFLSLNLGFPLCFYDGMTELWKTGLTLLFPLYLLTIVVALIILSRYSTWLSNRISHSSVQVLVTVVHLSFSKLLIAIIDVFTPARIYTDNGYIDVWFWDGTVRYLSPEHRNLVIYASLIVFPLLVPYITLLLLAKPLRRCSLANKYLRPVLEAIHAPYKEGKKYWFVLRLVLVITMYIVYTVYRGKNIFKLYLACTPILVFFVIVQAYIKPFKTDFLNIMDTWIMFNITFLYTTTWYYIISKDIKITITICVVGVLLVLINFLLILVYHFLWVTGLLAKIMRKMKMAQQEMSHHLRVFHRDVSKVRLVQPDHVSYSCEQYREPILSDFD